jgi:CDP-glucose 4,6-dehydratase
VIGGGDWSEDRLIPDLISGFQAKQPVMIRRPKAIRPWQHVLESLQGYIVLAEGLLAGNGRLASSFNFGPCEEPWPVEKVATRMVELWGDGASWVLDSSPSVHEEHCLMLDISKARSELGWQPRLYIGTALEWTCDWYWKWSSGADMAHESLRQIAQFQKLNAYRASFSS